MAQAVLVKVELLHIEDCPGWRDAEVSTRAVLDDLGLTGLRIEVRELTADDELRGAHFAGSPTILVDGQDIIAGAVPIEALACRIYTSPSGRAATPSRDQIRSAILGALDQAATASTASSSAAK
ncbi:hypothetical protein ACQ856_30760 (plasmid) [Mycolicibacterium psychrotolerans]|jgi:hypothetical protein|uniref:hypothetical protein n=1 Tax=Actinomycetes TaxID=1760 RepID=UPI00247AF675|nr:hypothetical protein [Amnibacterium kyonggiense]WDE72258.1 alkylmercury lyase [Amnibacterium kyonggiense]